jgi:hypothetical protein
MYAYTIAVIVLCMSSVAILDSIPTKPRPITYDIKHWNAVPLVVKFGKPVIKEGKPGDFIHFYDENGNEIKKYRYDQEKKEISVWMDTQDVKLKKYTFSEELLKEDSDFPLDLSTIFKKTDKK